MRPLATLLRLPLVLLLAAVWAAAPHAQTWTVQASGTAEVLNDVHFVSATTGFVVGDNGLLLSTADAGATWASRTLGGGAFDLEGVAFNADASVGLIVTDDGPVYRTTDGGATWALVATGMGDGRAAIGWGTGNAVWVAGREGNGAVSADAGTTWTFRPTGAADRTEGLAAVSATEAWVVGRGGEIRHTANGGATWAAQPSGTASDLKDVQMLDALTGYVAASNDVVLKTTTGGAAWANVSNGQAGGDGLFFLDAGRGWLVGDAGEIWHTADGGASWALQPSGTTQPLSRVHFPTATDGWAVGDGGAIVRFSGGGTTATGPGAAPRAFALAPAYPNPFNPATTLRYHLAEGGPVRLAVYDALGRRVAVVLDAVRPAGAGEAVFEAGALPGGLYLVRLETAAGATVRPVTLLR